MEKIPTAFLRSEQTHLVTPEVDPRCRWVADGSAAVPSRKFDGQCCLVRAGRLWRRRQLERDRAAEGLRAISPDGQVITGFSFPPTFELTAVDHERGLCYGWVPVTDGPEDRYFREAWETLAVTPPEGTYELCGPKVQGNPEGFDAHVLVPHGAVPLAGVPRDYDGLRQYLAASRIEGIVWRDPYGKMAKIKRRDFGFDWPIKATATGDEAPAKRRPGRPRKVLVTHEVVAGAEAEQPAADSGGEPEPTDAPTGE